MNNKNLVSLSENDLENISAGVNKKALGDAVEYGTAAVMMFPFGLLGKLLGFTVESSIVNEGNIGKVISYIKGAFGNRETMRNYIPIYGVGGELIIKEGIENGKDDIYMLIPGGGIVAGEIGAMVGGWFAGRALGKALRKKLGL